MSLPAQRILALDTSTHRTVLALGDVSGALLRAGGMALPERPGSALLGLLDALLEAAGMRVQELAGLVVGMGPGSFTGLRVGLGTVKTLGYLLGHPIAAISTAEALALSAARVTAEDGRYAVVSPAGVHDRYLTIVTVQGDATRADGDSRLVAGSAPFEVAGEEARLVALDLSHAHELPPAARELGTEAAEGLAAALLQLGARRLEQGEVADAAELVPAYVALPRGMAAIDDAVEWSLDR